MIMVGPKSHWQLADTHQKILVGGTEVISKELPSVWITSNLWALLQSGSRHQ